MFAYEGPAELTFEDYGSFVFEDYGSFVVPGDRVQVAMTADGEGELRIVSDAFDVDLAWALGSGIIAAYALSRGFAKAGSREGPFMVDLTRDDR